MLKDVIFNDDLSLFDEYEMVLTSSDVGMPSPKLSSVNIMGADGVLDLSTVLTDDVKFNNRKISLGFEMLDLSNYSEVITDLSNRLHGKIVTFSFSDDMDFYYQGRCTIDKWKCSRNKGTVEICIDAEPYKMEKVNMIVSITVTGNSKNYTLSNLRKVVCPDLVVTGTIKLTIGEEKIELTEGSYQLANVILHEGNTKITVSGNGSIKFTYKRGVL